MAQLSTRDKIRAATLGKKKVFKSKEATLYDGTKVEIRQPTVGQRSEIRSKSMTVMPNAEMRADMMQFTLWMVILQSYVPGTDERVFEEADYDEIAAVPSGDWVDNLTAIALELSNAEVGEEEAKKP